VCKGWGAKEEGTVPVRRKGEEEEEWWCLYPLSTHPHPSLLPPQVVMVLTPFLHSTLLPPPSYSNLIQRLGKKLGEPGLDLNIQFHHVIWAGDLNYRCVGSDGGYISSQEVVKMLREGRNREVRGGGYGGGGG